MLGEGTGGSGRAVQTLSERAERTGRGGSGRTETAEARQLPAVADGASVGGGGQGLIGHCVVGRPRG